MKFPRRFVPLLLCVLPPSLMVSVPGSFGRERGREWVEGEGEGEDARSSMAADRMSAS